MPSARREETSKAGEATRLSRLAIAKMITSLTRLPKCFSQLQSTSWSPATFTTHLQQTKSKASIQKDVMWGRQRWKREYYSMCNPGTHQGRYFPWNNDGVLLITLQIPHENANRMKLKWFVQQGWEKSLKIFLGSQATSRSLLPRWESKTRLTEEILARNTWAGIFPVQTPENKVLGRPWQSPSCRCCCFTGVNDLGPFGLGLSIQKMNLVLVPDSQDRWEGFMNSNTSTASRSRVSPPPAMVTINDNA